MTSGAIRLGSLAYWTALALLVHLGCASEVYVEPVDADEEPGDTGKLGGLGGAGTTSKPSGTGGSAGKASAGSAGRGGSSAGKANGGSQNGGKSAGGTGTDDGGEPGETTGGTSSGSGGSGGSAGSGGSLNQPAMCDEATATVLGSMNANVTVASNVCLKMTVPADQTWIKKITMQPEGGTYPLPFTWSNCGTNSSGAFTANYGNQILMPVNLQCPILVKLGGSGSPVNVQWWGG